MKTETKVVIDLDGTIKDSKTGSLLPGSSELFELLADKGIIPILWTQNSDLQQGWEEFLTSQGQTLAGIDENTLIIQGLEIPPAAISPALSEAAVHSLTIRMMRDKTKNPLLVGASAILDDWVDSRLAQTYGIKSIYPDDPEMPNRKEEPQAWAVAVLAAILD